VSSLFRIKLFGSLSLVYEAVIGVYGGFASSEWQYVIYRLAK
jgi:hypothetical protein